MVLYHSVCILPHCTAPPCREADKQAEEQDAAEVTTEVSAEVTTSVSVTNYPAITINASGTIQSLNKASPRQHSSLQLS